jgi:hypothetical protein
MKEIIVEFKDGTVMESKRAVFPFFYILWWNVYGIKTSSSDGTVIKPISSVSYIHISD